LANLSDSTLFIFLQLFIEDKDTETFPDSFQIRYVIGNFLYRVHLFLQEFSLQEIHKIRVVVCRGDPVQLE